MFVHCNALCFFHPWFTFFKASNISLWENNRDSLVLQCLWLCNNRFLLRCDLLLERSPPQHFRLFSLSFYSLSTVYSMSVKFKLSSFVSFSVLFCIFARRALSNNLRNHPSAKMCNANSKIRVCSSSFTSIHEFSLDDVITDITEQGL